MAWMEATTRLQAWYIPMHNPSTRPLVVVRSATIGTASRAIRSLAMVLFIRPLTIPDPTIVVADLMLDPLYTSHARFP